MLIDIYPCDIHPDCPYPYRPCCDCTPIDQLDAPMCDPADCTEDTTDRLEVTCSFDYLQEFTKDHEIPWTGYNQKGEVVSIEHSRDPIGEFYRVETFASDDYMSIDVYRPDGSHVNKIHKWN